MVRVTWWENGSPIHFMSLMNSHSTYFQRKLLCGLIAQKYFHSKSRKQKIFIENISENNPFQDWLYYWSVCTLIDAAMHLWFIQSTWTQEGTASAASSRCSFCGLRWRFVDASIAPFIILSRLFNGHRSGWRLWWRSPFPTFISDSLRILLNRKNFSLFLLVSRLEHDGFKRDSRTTNILQSPLQ